MEIGQNNQLRIYARNLLKMEDAVNTMRGRDLLCFSHDWSGDPLSKNHLMRALARDNRVLWVNSIGYRTPTASRADLSRAFRKLAAAFKRELANERPHVRVELVETPGLAANALALKNHEADLAVVRSDDPNAAEGRSVFVFRKRRRTTEWWAEQ